MTSPFLNALNCRNTGRPPVWLMRQAGRYMPEYREMRGKYAFLEMCHRPEIAAQVTLLPIKRFGFDAAILFSDILMVPEALGLGLQFHEGQGPVFERPLETEQDIMALPRFDAKDSLGFVAQAIRLLQKELKVPLIGFCGAPFTVASYMIQGRSSHDLKKTKQWMLRNPASFHRLLDLLADLSADYLNLQIEAGADALQLFDSWANYLDAAHFRECSLQYLKKILSKLTDPSIPVILFCRGASVFLDDLLEAESQAISLDWNIDLSKARSRVPAHVALQGNLDPDILYAPSQVIVKETLKLLKAMHNDPGYIFNLGHGIKPDIPVESVQTLVETIQSYGS